MFLEGGSVLENQSRATVLLAGGKQPKKQAVQDTKPRRVGSMAEACFDNRIQQVE